MNAVWTDDFDFSWGRRGVDLRVRKTGADVRVDGAVLRDLATWLAFYAPVRLKAAATGLLRPGPRVWFAPDRPRPWYLIWAVAAWGGVRFADSADAADVAFYFDDSTTGAAPAASVRTLNGACTDVSKSRVAAVFEDVFGYPLSIDPETWTGLAVEKGEGNGAHDGQVVACPQRRRADRVYQRVVDNAEGGLVHDLRTPFVGGHPVLVFVKSRPVDARFANLNTGCRLTTPEAVFSPEEVERLSAFARAMGLDWGGLDVLRDRASGRVYVVDVNKTDMGPPIALPWLDKLRAVRRLSRALLALLSETAS